MSEAAIETGTHRRSVTAGLMRVGDIAIRSLVPLLLALLAGGVLLAALGRNPFTFYGSVWTYGVAQGSWQQSGVTMIPFLLIATGLAVIFRANIWNLGYWGQFALGAALVAGLGPWLTTHLPLALAFALLFLVAGTAGAAWTLIPAVLKARYGTNEIITTLMMSFIGVGLADILIQGPFHDSTVQTPQTQSIDFDKLMPAIPSTTIDWTLIVALAFVGATHFLLTRTAFGLRLHILGLNPRAARHVGANVPRLIITSFLISGGLIGAAAAAWVLSPVQGYLRAGQIPNFGDLIIPFVFLARLNALAVVPFVAFYAVLFTGGTLATTSVNLPTDFLLVLVALILLFMTVIEYLGRRRELGASYVTPGLKRSLKSPIVRRRAT
jgi:general nucleoside transport system permease protein